MFDIAPLRESGLTDGETRVYLALLELGPSTTGPIVDKSGVSRSIVYQLLEQLIDKGLVGYVTKEKTKHYQAAEPSRLLDYIDERKKQLEDNRDVVANLLPQLSQLSHSASPVHVSVYEGFKGMITVHEHMYDKLGKGDWYYYLGILPEQRAHYHAYWLKDHKRRAKAGIIAKLLFHPDTEPKQLRNRNKLALCDARYMPTKINTPAWFMGYKDVAVIGLQDKPIVIEIVQQDIADSFRSYFEEFWAQSKKLHS